MSRGFAPPLAADRRGATVIEFAIIAPVLCLFLVGVFDIAHTLYMTAVLQGIVQKTGRDSALQTGNTVTADATIDARVSAQVLTLANNATISFNRRYYRTFSDAAAAKAEPWTDTNNDGRCDNGESYTDANGNGVWDSDGGNGGQGGAQDRTVYTATVSYPHMFPLYRFLGQSNTQTLVAKTVLQNQPYDQQGSYAAPVTRICT